MTVLKLEDDNLLEWNIALIVLNPSSLYYGGYFKVLDTLSAFTGMAWSNMTE